MLARFNGWGALSQVFDTRRDEWASVRSELLDLLGQEAYRQAEATTTTAFYTPQPVVEAAWQHLADLGLNEGRILEPGCGTGRFLGAAPDNGRIRLVGIELDETTARIARLLHPSAEVRAEGFERVEFRRGTFAGAIGNVPFGDFTLYDPTYNRGSFKIHDHFADKSLALTAPGGVAVLVTSAGTLDKANAAARTSFLAKADLLGAIRLPSGAFDEAGTEVVTDILVLRARKPGEEPLDTSWITSSPVDLGDGSHRLNLYFQNHPEQILGRLAVRQGRFGEELTVENDGRDLGSALTSAFGRIAEHARSVDRLADPTELVVTGSVAVEVPPRDVKEGAFYISADGALLRRLDGEGVEACTIRRTRGPDGATVEDRRPLKPAEAEEVRLLVQLRDAGLQTLDQQAAASWDGSGEPPWAGAQNKMSQAYDTYALRFGAINRHTLIRTGKVDPDTGEALFRRRYPSLGGFREDPDVQFVEALERYDEESGEYSKADMFSRRVIAPRMEPTGADTPKEALPIVLDRIGSVDMGEVARLTGLTEAECSTALLKEKLVYRLPDDADGKLRFETADAYLSGNVRRKLAQAEFAASLDPAFAPNVEALRSVIPADIQPGDISVKLGAPWIGTDDIAAFAGHLTGYVPEVRYTEATGDWTVAAHESARRHPAAISEWGTRRVNAYELLGHALQQTLPTVRDTMADDRVVVNVVETAAARERLEKIEREFADWIWSNPERAERLAKVYNERFNAHAPRRFDGSHLSVPGLSAAKSPYPHQKDVAWRAIQQGNVLVGHEPGMGKTLASAMIVMEERRLGLSNKPAVVVPNHLLEQFSREFREAFPKAKLLVADDDQMSPENRKAFVARCATGDWDAVIFTHSGFTRLPVSDATQKRFMAEELDTLREALTTAQEADGKDALSVKRLQSALKKAEAKLRAKVEGKESDDGLTFERTGIDRVIVDEAHLYKRLPVRSRIDGMSSEGSQRAVDLLMKLQVLEERRPGRSVVFLTGTPITNSVAEAHVLMRYLDPQGLEDRGLRHFDQWAALHGRTVTTVEVSPTGAGVRMKTRFARFDNLPELARHLETFSDIKRVGDAGIVVTRPPLDDGTGREAPKVIVSEAPPSTQAYIDELVERAEKIAGGGIDPSVDNMLKITGEGRRVALDPRMVGLPLPEGERSKLHDVADEVARIWTERKDIHLVDKAGKPERVPGALQLVFLDIGTPGAGDSQDGSAYAILKNELVARGIPADRVRFVHDAKSDEERGALFSACREGGVDVLIGSTEKMGTGVNVQRRAAAVHHVDCPWRPDQIEQRTARALRQGNLNSSVLEVRYVAKGTFDAYMWQTNERKATMVAEAILGGRGARSAEDVEAAALTFAEAKAAASGNPLVAEKFAVDAEVTRLTTLRRAFDSERVRLANEAIYAKEAITATEALIAKGPKVIAQSKDGLAAAVEINGKRPYNGQEAGRAILALARRAATTSPTSFSEIARFGSDPVRFLPPSQLAPGRLAFGPPKAEIILSISQEQLTAPGDRLPDRFATAVEGMTRDLAQAPARLLAAQQKLSQLEARLAQPFAYADDLARATARSKEIAEALMPKASEGLAATTEDGTFVPNATPAAGALAPKAGFRPIEVEGSNARKADVTAYDRGFDKGLSSDSTQAAREVLKCVNDGKEHRAVGVIEGFLRSQRGGYSRADAQEFLKAGPHGSYRDEGIIGRISAEAKDGDWEQAPFSRLIKTAFDRIGLVARSDETLADWARDVRPLAGLRDNLQAPHWNFGELIAEADPGRGVSSLATHLADLGPQVAEALGKPMENPAAWREKLRPVLERAGVMLPESDPSTTRRAEVDTVTLHLSNRFSVEVNTQRAVGADSTAEAMTGFTIRRENSWRGEHVVARMHDDSWRLLKKTDHGELDWPKAERFDDPATALITALERSGASVSAGVTVGRVATKWNSPLGKDQVEAMTTWVRDQLQQASKVTVAPSAAVPSEGSLARAFVDRIKEIAEKPVSPAPPTQTPHQRGGPVL